MDRGVKAVNRLVEYIVFSITPTIVDIITGTLLQFVFIRMDGGNPDLQSLNPPCFFLITDQKSKSAKHFKSRLSVVQKSVDSFCQIAIPDKNYLFIEESSRLPK